MDKVSSTSLSRRLKFAKTRTASQVALIVLLVLSALPDIGYSDQYDVLFEEFDARPLRSDEKTFLQGALALQGYYTSLLDGKWGTGSQSALEKYTYENYDTVPLNLHVTTLLMDYLDSFEIRGWRTRFLPDIGISLILPDKTMIQRENENGFYRWDTADNSLIVVAASQTTVDMTALHTKIRKTISYRREPYTIQYRNRWVTSIENRDGLLVYIRSEWMEDRWATVSIVASKQSANELNFISTSIIAGRTDGFDLPRYGALEKLVNLTLDWIDETKNAGSNAKPESAEFNSSAENPSQSNNEGPSTGSGFVVDTYGNIVTNAHVVRGCNSVAVSGSTYLVSATSDTFDLALLKPATVRTTRSFVEFANRPAKLNADVTVVGYPLYGVLGGLNVTRGAVTSLSGLGGNSAQMQISAPVQPGNSGGPVLDRSGNVIGVVVAKLDSLEVAKAIGDIPQNINFAIRGEIVKLFLGNNNIEYSFAGSEDKMEPTTLAANAAKYTVLVECD